MDNETALLIEQSRQTHALVKATYEMIENHIKEDKVIAETVLQHATYWGITKWIVVTGVLFILGLFGYKH